MGNILDAYEDFEFDEEYPDWEGDYWGPDPDPVPEAWHTIDIYGNENGARAVHATNDNLDQGWASEYATWETTYPNLEKAIEDCGKSRQGVLCSVTVTVNGKEV